VPYAITITISTVTISTVTIGARQGHHLTAIQDTATGRRVQATQQGRQRTLALPGPAHHHGDLSRRYYQIDTGKHLAVRAVAIGEGQFRHRDVHRCRDTGNTIAIVTGIAAW